MDTQEQIQEARVPVQVDVTESLPLEVQLKAMTKRQLIEYGGNLGFNIDRRLKESTIIQNILAIVADRKSNAAKTNAESLRATVTEDDPMIEVRFFNIETPGVDIEFAFAGKKGMYGPKYIKDGKTYGNPKGHRKCPKYHLFPGEVTKVAYSVYEHLESLTFVTHKTVFDPVSGMIQGNIPIVKPRFILQPVVTKSDLININKNR